MPDQDATRFAPDRHAAILRLVEREGRVVSAQLAARLGVSMDTVRRDLAELEAFGALQRVHGGAVRGAPGARRFDERLREADGGRAVVAGLGAALVERGQVVAIGGGTTSLRLARALPRDLEATVVTTSPEVVLALDEHPGVDVDLLGGRLHRVSRTVTGADTVAQLRALCPDVCLLSPCGFDVQLGVTLREREEALVAQAMVERALRTVVLAPAAKLGTAGAYVVAPADRVDVLVTDAPPAALGAFAGLGIALVTPEPSAQAPQVALGA
jgi:DeoR/GlpR family transcriptional regulator of sugar metabolism